MKFNLVFLIVLLGLAFEVAAQRGRGQGRGGRGGRGGKRGNYKGNGRRGPRKFANGIVTDYGTPNDAFEIKNIILRPARPVRGRPLEVQIVGVLRETLSRGSYFSVNAKWGGMSLLNKKEDLCNVAVKEKTGYRCPIKPQYFNLRHKAQIPAFAPSGVYVIDSFGYSANKRRIFKIRINANI